MIRLTTKTNESPYVFSLKDSKEKMDSLKSSLAELVMEMTKLYNTQEIMEGIRVSVSELITTIKEVYGDGINGYERWGEYGWTYCPSLDFEMFKNAPESFEEASKRMERFLSNNEIDKICFALNKTEANAEEIQEAYYCFCEEKYKACALILFGIIDNKIYRYGLLNKGSKVALGAQFAKKYCKQKQYDDLICEGIFVNILKSIETIFAYGDNFTNKMIIINRNYLSHGMAKRNISKTECFQVWCLTYSVWVLLDVVEKCNMENDDAGDQEEQK